MSLYYVQKLIYNVNRDADLLQRFMQDKDAVMQSYDLTDEEKRALRQPDIGLLYVLGVNGQLLMHYAAAHKVAWPDYIQAMRDGIEKHGQVREGVYTMIDGKGAI